MLSQCGMVRLGNFVDPKYTIGAAIRKKFLERSEEGEGEISLPPRSVSGSTAVKSDVDAAMVKAAARLKAMLELAFR